MDTTNKNFPSGVLIKNHSEVSMSELFEKINKAEYEVRKAKLAYEKTEIELSYLNEVLTNRLVYIQNTTGLKIDASEMIKLINFFQGE